MTTKSVSGITIQNSSARFLPRDTQPKTREFDIWSVMSLLRFILASSVLCGHIAGSFCKNAQTCALVGSLGQDAVVCFFVISGISISHSVHTQPKGFITRRFDRIYPLYFLAVVLGSVIYALYGTMLNSPLGGAFDSPRNICEFLSAFIFLQNFTTNASHGFWANAPLWSVCIEMMYYCSAPLLNRL
jgi:peptidoglycan/LPS O-acetylase OafA/YrhL